MNEKDYQAIEERWAKAYDGDDRQAVRKAMKDVSNLLAEVRRLNKQIKSMLDPENLPHQRCPVEECLVVQELKKQNTTFCKDCPRFEDDYD